MPIFRVQYHCDKLFLIEPSIVVSVGSLVNVPDNVNGQAMSVAL